MYFSGCLRIFEYQDFLQGIKSNSVLFQNPASNQINVLISKHIEENFTVEIYNSIGQQIGIFKVNDENSFIIDVGNFQNGLYSYSIKSNDQCIGTGKLSIIH